MNDELSTFIDAVYREPYSLIGNNCVNKSLRIKARAEELGEWADLIVCISIAPVKKWYNFPLILPHVYVEVEGEKVDISFDPQREGNYYRNNEAKIVMPVDISKARRTACRLTSHNGFLSGRLHGYR